MKCGTKDCENHNYQGRGLMVVVIGEDGLSKTKWFCMPCWAFIIDGDGRHSQVYRNAVSVADKEKPVVSAVDSKVAVALLDEIVRVAEETRIVISRQHSTCHSRT